MERLPSETRLDDDTFLASMRDRCSFFSAVADSKVAIGKAQILIEKSQQLLSNLNAPPLQDD